MLIITRKVGETIVINGDIEIVVYKASYDNARIGINAPKNVRVNRGEIEEKYRIEQEEQSSKPKAVV